MSSPRRSIDRDTATSTQQEGQVVQGEVQHDITRNISRSSSSSIFRRQRRSTSTGIRQDGTYSLQGTTPGETLRRSRLRAEIVSGTRKVKLQDKGKDKGKGKHIGKSRQGSNQQGLQGNGKENGGFTQRGSSSRSLGLGYKQDHKHKHNQGTATMRSESHDSELDEEKQDDIDHVSHVAHRDSTRSAEWLMRDIKEHEEDHSENGDFNARGLLPKTSSAYSAYSARSGSSFRRSASRSLSEENSTDILHVMSPPTSTPPPTPPPQSPSINGLFSKSKSKRGSRRNSSIVRTDSNGRPVSRNSRNVATPLRKAVFSSSRGRNGSGSGNDNGHAIRKSASTSSASSPSSPLSILRRSSSFRRKSRRNSEASASQLQKNGESIGEGNHKGHSGNLEDLDQEHSPEDARNKYALVSHPSTPRQDVFASYTIELLSPDRVAAIVENYFYSVSSVRRAMKFRPRKNDVILASAPRTGQSLVIRLLRLLGAQNDAEMNGVVEDVNGTAPWIESTYVDDDPFALLREQPGNFRIFRSHMTLRALLSNRHLDLDLDRARKQDTDYLLGGSPAKYITIFRHPADLQLSWYKHLKACYYAGGNGDEAHPKIPGRFDELFSPDDFLDVPVTMCQAATLGKGVNITTYEHNILDWYKARDYKNVHIIFYEELLDQPARVINELRDFLEIPMSTKKLKKILSIASEHYGLKRGKPRPMDRKRQRRLTVVSEGIGKLRRATGAPSVGLSSQGDEDFEDEPDEAEEPDEPDNEDNAQEEVEPEATLDEDGIHTDDSETPGESTVNANASASPETTTPTPVTTAAARRPQRRNAIVKDRRKTVGIGVLCFSKYSLKKIEILWEDVVMPELPHCSTYEDFYETLVGDPFPFPARVGLSIPPPHLAGRVDGMTWQEMVSMCFCIPGLANCAEYKMKQDYLLEEEKLKKAEVHNNRDPIVVQHRRRARGPSTAEVAIITAAQKDAAVMKKEAKEDTYTSNTTSQTNSNNSNSNDPAIVGAAAASASASEPVPENRKTIQEKVNITLLRARQLFKEKLKAVAELGSQSQLQLPPQSQSQSRAQSRSRSRSRSQSESQPRSSFQEVATPTNNAINAATPIVDNSGHQTQSEPQESQAAALLKVLPQDVTTRSPAEESIPESRASELFNESRQSELLQFPPGLGFETDAQQTEKYNEYISMKREEQPQGGFEAAIAAAARAKRRGTTAGTASQEVEEKEDEPHQLEVFATGTQDRGEREVKESALRAADTLFVEERKDEEASGSRGEGGRERSESKFAVDIVRPEHRNLVLIDRMTRARMRPSVIEVVLNSSEEML